MSNAITGSVALTELKSDLTQLSTTLHDVFDLMNADMSKVGDAWQDGKYQEFVDGYRPQIQKCEDISVRYSEWCKRVLDPTIENVIAVEKTDVGSGSGSIGGVGATGAVSSGSAAMGSAARKISGFNTGRNINVKESVNTGKNNTPNRENNPNWIERNVINPLWGTKEEREVNRIKNEGPKTPEEVCKVDFPGTHAVPKSPNDPTARKLHVSNTNSGGEWNTNVKVGYETPPTPYGKGSAGLGGGYNSGKKSSTSERDIFFDCEPDDK